MIPVDIPRRLRAARYLAGFATPYDLARAINQRGLSGKTLYSFEQGNGDPQLRDLETIAYTCGLPVEWFSADFDRLPEIANDARAVLAQELAAASERAKQRREASEADRLAQCEEGPAR